MSETSTVERPALPAHAARSLPELLAPAGDWECARAAVENGADAIYFGLEKFNARMRAHNFTEADLPKVMAFLHSRGVRGYVTLNTLVFENELADAERYLRTMITAGVDAVIVQDVGICQLIRELSPDFPIHASTQMTITSAAGVEFARELGCQLIVLARECSIKEIEKFQTSKLPLEVFVHGALCVAYSGQCLTSEALGGRSANRGECAQACRMPYDLISDGNPVSLGDRKYLLSPQDLAGLDVLPELARTGVASLKIEGRLKSPEYVANITRVYRQALDDLRFTNGNLRPAEASTRQNAPTPSLSHPMGEGARRAGEGWRVMKSTDAAENRKYELEMAFSRGLYTGWFGGVNNQELVHARFGKKRGVYLGEVQRVLRDAVVVNLQAPLKPGDGVVFDAGHPEEHEEGGRVYEVSNQRAAGVPPADRNGNQTGCRRDAGGTLKFGKGDIDFSRIHVGDKLWKTDDPELNRRLRKTFEGDAPKFQRPLDVEVHGLIGKPLTVIGRDEFGNVAKVESAMPLAHAEKQPLTTEKLREQFGRLGGTPFRLGALTNRISGEVMLPVSELNRLRREVVAELEQQRIQPKRWTLAEQSKGCATRQTPSSHPSPIRWERVPEGRVRVGGVPQASPTLIVLVRNLAQLEAAMSSGVKTVYCDFENPKKYRDAVGLFRTVHPSLKSSDELERGASLRPSQLAEQCSALRPGFQRANSQENSQPASFNPAPSIFVAPPRIFKEGERWTLDQVRSCNADGYLVRNYDHLKFFDSDRRVGDFSLNIANRLSADYFRNRFGLERVTASYDLNFHQLEALLRAAPPEWFEVTIHQHIPMFHMEHCVFCAFLSSGTDYTNCGRPCDKHDVKLRDRVGAEHPVKADVGCRNTVFNALAQTGAEYVTQMLALGLRHFRIEFLNETPAQVRQTIQKYRQLLNGEITGAQLWRELKLLNQLGVTRGQIAGTQRG